jgi:uncharacterized membrane protein YkvA (DUF1232 family)
MTNKPNKDLVTPQKNGEIIKEEAHNVTDKDVELVIDKSEEIKKKFNTRGPLGRFIEDGQLLIAIIKDYWSGAYRKIPYGMIGSIVITLIYVLNPFDLVPDMLPLIGQVDDVAVLGACLIMVEQDLHKYKDWKQAQD